jgi:dipeptidyl-peptidase 4
MKRLVFPLLLLLPAWADDLRDAYHRAERLLPVNLRSLVLNDSVVPHWTGSGSEFWYRRSPNEVVLIRPEKNGRSLVDASQFCKVDPAGCAAPGPAPLAGVASPDGRTTAFVKDNNLYVRNLVNGNNVVLTRDGTPELSYGVAVGNEERTALGHAPDFAISWSPDSRYIASILLNTRGVTRTSIVRSIVDGAPGGETFLYPMAGDSTLPTAQLVIAEPNRGTVRIVKSERWFLPGDSPVASNPLESDLWWSAHGDRVYWIQKSRGSRTISLWTVSPGSGQGRKLIEESSATRTGTSNGSDLRNVRDLSNGDIVWFSERDGWGHLYLYDGHSGRLKNRITSGPWLVRELLYVDEASRSVFFTASGRQPGRDPYYRHLYRAPLEGGDPTLLTAENADHSITFSPDGRYFIDTYSTPEQAPITVLRRADGAMVLDLERADASALLKIGWRPPEPFTVKAADGITDLYGAIYRPSNFDPSRKYPIIDDIYPSHRRPIGFGAPRFMPDYGQSTAELGFIVVALDARGGTMRSKAFADAGYGDLAGRLDDHVAAIRELGRRHSYFDLTRVGIYGHSVGGGAAAEAILTYPEFYRVAVCSAGILDMRVAPAEWGEWWMGPRSKSELLQASPVALAPRLAGKLLVVHGELDHAAQALRFADALIQAGKDFELEVIPNRQHNVPSHPFFIRKKWDFFVRHLLDEEPPADFHLDIAIQP